MIHPDQKPNYQQKLEEAAQNWLLSNPDSKQTVKQIAEEIRKNNLKYRCNKPCCEFNYSGTRWCDDCGFEKEDHPK